MSTASDFSRLFLGKYSLGVRDTFDFSVFSLAALPWWLRRRVVASAAQGPGAHPLGAHVRGPQGRPGDIGFSVLSLSAPVLSSPRRWRVENAAHGNVKNVERPCGQEGGGGAGAGPPWQGLRGPTAPPSWRENQTGPTWVRYGDPRPTGLRQRCWVPESPCGLCRSAYLHSALSP